MYYDNYFEELKFALTKIDRNLLVGIESMIIKTVKKDGNIYLLGNGGNTATASHWVCDFNKGIGILSDKSVRMISLSDNISLLTAYANDASYDDIYLFQLEKIIQKRDLIIILSVSGNSGNLVKAAKYAKENNITVISIVGDYNGKVLDYSDISLIVYSKNYGIVEDIQLSLGHMISQNIKNSNIDIYR